MGRLEHRFNCELRTTVEVGSFPHQGFIALLLLKFERAAERFQAKFTNELGAAGDRGFARDEATRVAAAEGVAREFLGCRAVRFEEEWGEVLGLILILEAVDKIFRGELVGGGRLVAEQVADSVVVLVMGQPAERDFGSSVALAGGLFLAILESASEIVAREGGELADPSGEHAFIIAACGEAGAAGVGGSIGGFLEEERFGGLLAVDKYDEGLAKAFDLVGSCVGFRKQEAGDGSYAIRIVAGSASGLLEHLEGALGERLVLRPGRAQRKRKQCKG